MKDPADDAQRILRERALALARPPSNGRIARRQQAGAARVPARRRALRGGKPLRAGGASPARPHAAPRHAAVRARHRQRARPDPAGLRPEEIVRPARAGSHRPSSHHPRARQRPGARPAGGRDRERAQRARRTACSPRCPRSPASAPNTSRASPRSAWWCSISIASCPTRRSSCTTKSKIEPAPGGAARMKWNVGTKIGVGFGIALAIFVIVGESSPIEASTKLIAASEWRQHTYDVLARISALQLQLQGPRRRAAQLRADRRRDLPRALPRRHGRDRQHARPTARAHARQPAAAGTSRTDRAAVRNTHRPSRARRSRRAAPAGSKRRAQVVKSGRGRETANRSGAARRAMATKRRPLLKKRVGADRMPTRERRSRR